MKTLAKTGIHALQLLLIQLQSGEIRIGTVNVMPVVVVDKSVMNRAPDDIARACDSADRKILRSIRTDTVFQHITDNLTVFMPGILKQVFTVHKLQRVLL